MDSFLIKGGRPLEGDVHISGAKNSVLPIMAAALLTPERCVIRRVPDLSDVRFMGKILESLGAKVYDLSAFSDGFIDHGAYAAAPDVLHAIGAQMATPRAAETNTVSIIDASGYVDKPAN